MIPITQCKGATVDYIEGFAKSMGMAGFKLGLRCKEHTQTLCQYTMLRTPRFVWNKDMKQSYTVWDVPDCNFILQLKCGCLADFKFLEQEERIDG